MVRIVCISDTHNQHRDIKKMPKGDILIHAGDFTYTGKYMDVLDFANWIQDLPYAYKIIIAGNHEESFCEQTLRYKDANAKGLIADNTKVIYLENDSVEVMGLKFYGTPDQPIFFDWAFNYSDEYLQYSYSRIPDDTDVLITHCPPFGILDKSVRDDRCGSIELLNRVKQLKKLKLHVFGHLHEARNIVAKDNVTFVNACICDKDYKPVNEPIVIDV